MFIYYYIVANTYKYWLDFGWTWCTQGHASAFNLDLQEAASVQPIRQSNAMYLQIGATNSILIYVNFF